MEGHAALVPRRVTAEAPEGTQRAQGPIASYRHTTILVVVLLVIAAFGALGRNAVQPAARNIFPLYISLVATEGALLFYVSRGIRKTGLTLADLVGGRWKNARDIAVDVLVAAIIWTTWLIIAWLISPFLPPSLGPLVNTLLPRNLAESVLWILVSVAAGLAEEITFRGYFQRQAIAMTSSPAIAVIAQAVIFGVSHGYQGLVSCVRITIYGLLLGVVAYWRRSLRPGIIVHAWTDVAGGILRV